jgi:DNA-directed RNA polymerase specialized sigma24 family protein
MAEDGAGRGMGQEKTRTWALMEARLAVYLRTFSGLGAEDREDALQAALVAFWRSGPEAEEDARPWHYRVARNAAVDALRRGSGEARGPRSWLSGSTPAAEEPQEPGPGPEERLHLGRGEGLRAEFPRRVSDAERELAYLTFSEGLSYEQAAILTGTPWDGEVRLSGVKRRLEARYRRLMK